MNLAQNILKDMAVKSFFLGVLILLVFYGEAISGSQSDNQEYVRGIEKFKIQIEAYFSSTVAPQIYMDIKEYLEWKERPEIEGSRWVFNLKDKSQDWYNFHNKYINMLNQFEQMIDTGKVDIDQKLTYFIRLRIPVEIIVGSNKHIQQFEVALSRNKSNGRNTLLKIIHLDKNITWDLAGWRCIFITRDNGKFVDFNRARTRMMKYGIAVEKEILMNNDVQIQLGPLDQVEIEYDIFSNKLAKQYR